MPFTPAIGDIVQVTLIVQNGEQVAAPRINFNVTAQAGPTPPTLTQIASFYSAGFSAFLLPTMCTDSSFRGALASKIFPLPRPAYESSTTAAGPGTEALGKTLPRQTALVVKLATAQSGRDFRGRFYMPFPSSTFNDVGGLPTAAYVTAVNGILPILFSPQVITVGGSSSTLAPVIFHKRTGLYTYITSSVAERKWGTIRRRGSFGRPNIPPI